jgi:septal ring factor EnvC (AmiA/AmiB activator)
MKRFLILACLISGAVLIQSSELTAQSGAIALSASPVLDAKTQKKVDQARVDLAKNLQKFNKDTASFNKATAKFDKDLQSGKLSPNQIEKEKAMLNKLSAKLDKLKASISKDQEFLEDYN